MAALSYGAMILSPHYPDRASFGTMVFLMVPILHMFSKIMESKPKMKVPSYAIGLFIWLGGMFPLCTYICQMIGWIK